MKNYFFYICLSCMLFFISCSQEAKLSTDFLPEEDALNIKITDTFTVNLTTVKDDSLETTTPSKLLLGCYKDPVFGWTRAEFATQILINGNSSMVHPYYAFDGIADSLVVYLALDTVTLPNIYGNVSTPLKINVYKLKKALTTDDVFYSNTNNADYKGDEIIGSATFYPGMQATIAIPLSNELAQDFITRADYYFNVNDELSFQEMFYGLYFAVENTTDNSVIAKISPSMSATKMTLSYIPEGADSVYTYDFLINYNALSFNLFWHDYAGTVIQNAITNPLPDDAAAAYIQAMGGTKVKLEIPNFAKTMSADKNIINKAELIIKTEQKNLTQDDIYPPDNTLAIVGYNSKNQLIIFEEFLKNNAYTGAEYSDGEYRFILTKQLQKMMNQSMTYDFYLISLQRKYNFARSVITTNKNTNPIKLVVTYTQY